jgi:transglutaminase superfamily protein
MRKVGLLAFGVTSLVLTPAVLHQLTAGPQQIAKLVAPDASSVQIGDATIDISADRAIADPGEAVRVKLRATAPKAEQVSVGLLVLESMGTYNGRVEQPPNRTTLETYTLDAAPGGGAEKEVAIRLPGNRKPGEMQLGRYTVLVMTPKTAQKLDQLRRRAQGEGAAPSWDPMNSASPRHQAYQSLYYGLLSDTATRDADDDEAGPAPERAARLDVMTRPANSPIAIQAPEQAVVGQEISVVVKVTNPTKRRVAGLTVQLQQPDLFGDSYHGLGFEQVSLSTESASLALAPRETKQVEFHLTAKQAGTLGLWATISCDEECGGYDQRLNDGNLEAIDIAPAPKASPAVAASR